MNDDGDDDLSRPDGPAGKTPSRVPSQPRNSQGSANYVDFEIEIESGEGRLYPVAVLHSPAGEAHEVMHFPFDELALESRLKSLEIALLRSGGGRRQVLSPEDQVVQDFGRQLFNALITGEARSRYDLSSDNARQRGLGMRIKLRINAPELARLPWEFLYDPRQAEYVCLSRDTPIIRYIELPQSIKPFLIQPPLQILGMVANPMNLPPLDIDREKQRVETAVEALQACGLVKLTWLEGQSWRDLQRAMRSGPWHIFHFIGHGGFDANADEGLIYLESESGAAHSMFATEIGRLLSDHRSLRLAILNVCEGARGGETDIFSSTASILVRRGMPAVVAMQYAITDRAAIEFSRAFYEALADGMPVDAAVCEARKAVSLAVTNTFEWGTPVLFMRAPDGKIFELSDRPGTRSATLQQKLPAPPDSVQELRLEELYTEGLAAFYVEDWEKACRSFQAILRERSDHAAAAAKLEEARRQRQLAALYTNAQERQKAGDWQGAVRALEELTQAAANYKDAGVLLKNARKRKQLEEFYDEAKQLHSAKQWQAVVNVFARITAIDPAFPDPDALLASAQKEVAERQRKERLKNEYNQAIFAMDAGRWQEAHNLLQQVNETEPGFMETGRLLTRVEAEIAQTREQQQRQKQVAVLYEQAHNLARGRKWQQALAKMEEIQKLDETFADPDKIAEKANRALEGEEKETQQQAELAEMYTEAVRMMDEGNYQGALQRWNEVRARDPKYPDRQNIQATASRRLKPLTRQTPKIRLPRRLKIPIWGWIITLPILLAVLLVGYFALYEPTLAPIRNQNYCPSTSQDNVTYITSKWQKNPVIFDGKITYAAEWSDASCTGTRLGNNPDGPRTDKNSISAQVWVKNDGEWLYLLARLPLADFQSKGIILGYFYPYPHTTVWANSDNMGYDLEKKTLFDEYGWDEKIWYKDAEASPPGKMNSQGTASRDENFTWFELRKPLHSGDGYDWDWQPGKRYGTNITGNLMIGSWGQRTNGDATPWYFTYLLFTIANE